MVDGAPGLSFLSKSPNTTEMENRSKTVVSRLKTRTSSTQLETVLLSISSDGSNFPLNSAKAALSLRRAADDLTGDDGRRPRHRRITPPRETRIPPTGSTRGRSRTTAGGSRGRYTSLAGRCDSSMSGSTSVVTRQIVRGSAQRQGGLCAVEWKI